MANTCMRRCVCVSLLEALTQSLSLCLQRQKQKSSAARRGNRSESRSACEIRLWTDAALTCDPWAHLWLQATDPPFQWAGLPSAAAFCVCVCVCVCVFTPQTSCPWCESKQQTFVFCIWPSEPDSYASHLYKHETLGPIWIRWCSDDTNKELIKH